MAAVDQYFQPFPLKWHKKQKETRTDIKFCLATMMTQNFVKSKSNLHLKISINWIQIVQI